MRKKTINYGLDKLFWFLVMILPILVLVLIALAVEIPEADNNTFFVFAFGRILTNLFYVSTDSVIFQALLSLFGSGGLLASFGGNPNPILLYLTYCVYIEILHVVFDVLVFIPRLAHKYCEKLCQNED